VAGKRSYGSRYGGGATEGLYWPTVGEEVKTEEEDVKKKCESRKFDSGVYKRVKASKKGRQNFGAANLDPPLKIPGSALV
jgi:hypothetical protein